MFVIRFFEIFTKAPNFPMKSKKMFIDPHRPNLNPARPYKYINISTLFISSFFVCPIVPIYPCSRLILMLIFSIHTSSQREKVIKKSCPHFFQTDLAGS